MGNASKAQAQNSSIARQKQRWASQIDGLNERSKTAGFKVPKDIFNDYYDDYYVRRQ
jgi:hypothetical protein